MYFNCFFSCNQRIFYLLITLLIVITQRRFGRFVYNNHCRAFISLIWMHLQIVSNACTNLHEYHVSILIIFLFYKHISL